MATTVAAALAAELGLRTGADLRRAAAGGTGVGADTAATPGTAGAGLAAPHGAAHDESRTSPAIGPPKTILPVTPDISALLPHGGLATVTAITATRRGATSLLWRLLAGPTAAGAWCALVGLPRVYPLAATAAGVDLGRVALVDPAGRVAEAAGTLAEGVAVIVVPSEGLSPAQARRLTARARGTGTSIVWWETRPVAGADTRLQVSRARWNGLRENAGRRWGSGRINACELDVASRWRSGGVRRASIWPYGGMPPEHVLDLRDRAVEPQKHLEPRHAAEPGGGAAAVVDLHARTAGSEGGRPAGPGAAGPPARAGRGERR